LRLKRGGPQRASVGKPKKVVRRSNSSTTIHAQRREGGPLTAHATLCTACVCHAGWNKGIRF
jgi:hypothetical protein